MTADGGQDRARRLLERIADRYREILGDRLVGVYEHGSLAFGCFRWAVSDIDFLVVVSGEVPLGEKETLIRTLLDLRTEAPEKGFEMSVIREEVLQPFVYPTPFELHYSETWYAECQSDLRGYCERMNGVDPDLAAHCAVMRLKGRTAAGEAIDRVFGEVPRAAYLDSIRRDIQGARDEIAENPVYITLNLCRVLAAVREGAVLSKAQGGAWGLERLDKRWQGMISGALAAYAGDGTFAPDEAEARAFAEHMLEAIGKNNK